MSGRRTEMKQDLKIKKKGTRGETNEKVKTKPFIIKVKELFQQT